MEVYSWEFMLDKGQGSELSFARKMNEAGYLDCYVFISMYHISFHEQFAKWSKDNKDRVKTYIDTYLVKWLTNRNTTNNPENVLGVICLKKTR